MNSLYCTGVLGRDFGTMMVVSMSGKQAPGIVRPPMVLRTCKLHQAGSVSVRGLAGASRMDSILRVSRRFPSDLGSRTVSSSSSMPQGWLVLGVDQKGFMVHGRVWRKRNCREGIRCESAAAASSAQGPAFEPDAKAPSASGRMETMLLCLKECGQSSST